MIQFTDKKLPEKPDACAPDGSAVRVLPAATRGSMAHFELAAGETSTAVVHRSIEEIWFILGGQGEMWRKQGDRDEVIALVPGLSLTIPTGTVFQFRAASTGPLTAVGVSMPPWPGEGEAVLTDGKWRPTVPKP